MTGPTDDKPDPKDPSNPNRSEPNPVIQNEDLDSGPEISGEGEDEDDSGGTTPTPRSRKRPSSGESSPA